MPNLNAAVLPGRPILPDWFNTESGRALLDQQQTSLATLVPDQFYRVGLQFGMGKLAMIKGLSVEQAVYLDVGGGEKASGRVLALPESLPFADSSVDLALLIHTLDYCENPHRVLREITQCLSPEGVLVLTGFHPYSLWGAQRHLPAGRGPFDARFISRTVIQDWLELLGFQALTGCMLNYQFQGLNTSWRRRLGWMNDMGDRWWPTLGAVYVLVVRKKIYGGLGHRNTQKTGRKWFPELKPSPARVARRKSLD
jgi:SAM-dependent methyltransferase